MLSSIFVEGRALAGSELARLAADISKRLRPYSGLIVSAADRIALLAAMLAGETAELQVIAAPSYWTEPQFCDAIRLCKPQARVRSSGTESTQLVFEELNRPAPAETGLVLFSSGTTGTPKGVRHTWSTIAASGRFVPERLQGRTWYVAYEPAGFAGLQVFFAARSSHGLLVIPRAGATFREHAELIAQHRVEVISATPTWWRMLITAWPTHIAVPELLQATLGGEIVDQATLDLVRRFFNPAQLTHVYASSEAGTAIVVSDGMAGFPEEWLLDADRTVPLRVKEDMLEVRSPFRMRGYVNAADPTANDGWLPTGDVIDVRDGRCHFVGRADQRLNIGGSKVTPEEVEACLQQQSDILDCLVYGKQNPIMGTLLVADIVPAHADSFDAVALRRKLGNRLPPYKIPQHFRVVTEIPLAANGKKRRA
jgi:acyl-coenzyme A synthetase/AMP-(fatty) acid ligase